MDSDWLPTAEIQEMLGNAERLNAYVDESPLRAVNDQLDFLVLIRDHDAWHIEGHGWNDANEPPDIGGSRRQMLNYYDKTTWSKLYVPQSSLIESVNWDRDAFVFNCSNRTIRATPRQVWLAVQDSMTGRGLSEDEIEYNFGKLDGSSPLKYHAPDSA